LFDLFGEEGFCTICQTSLSQGDRVRAIQKCQHLYHAECLEPWLRTHTTCPVCRTSVFPEDEEDTNYHNTILNLWTLIQAQVQRIQTEYHRRLLTWIVWDGILHQLTNAEAFTTQINTIRHYLIENRLVIHDVEILPSEAIRNRTQMIRQLRELTREIGRMDNLESIRQIRAHRDVAIFRTHVQAFASTRENFRSIWV
jgi:hypothetical protein